MKEKFTQQEWKVVDGTKVGEQVLFVHAPEVKGVICRLTHTANPNIPLSEADIANAHLIAAAPRMYAMLERVYKVEHERGGFLGVDGQFYYKVSESVFKEIEKLLAEARGEL